MKSLTTTILILCSFFCKAQFIHSENMPFGDTSTIHGWGYFGNNELRIENIKSIIETQDSIIAIQKRYIEHLKGEIEMWQFLYFLNTDTDEEPVFEDDKPKPFNQ